MLINVTISDEDSRRQWSIFRSGTFTWWSSRMYWLCTCLQVYMLQRMNKNHPFTCCCTQNTASWPLSTSKKKQWYAIVLTSLVTTFSSTKSLLTWVPLAKVSLEQKDNAKWKTPKKVTFWRSGPQTLNSCHSLKCACNNDSIIYFNGLCNPIELYNYARKKRPFSSYSAAKHRKHSKFAITDIREKPMDFFIVQHRHKL